MAENLDILNTAVSLLIRAALLAAGFSGRVRRRSLKRLASRNVDAKVSHWSKASSSGTWCSSPSTSLPVARAAPPKRESLSPASSSGSNVTHDKQNFLTFLIRRLPQRIPAKLVLVLVSNRLNWPEHLDPRVKSFLRMNEIVFEPYDALDLQHILRIGVEKALFPNSLELGVIEKIAAIASREHGDARKAVKLLARSAYLAEKNGTKVTIGLVDQAASELETDRYLTLVKTGPAQMQAVMAAVIEAQRKSKKHIIDTGEAYDTYRAFCTRADVRPLTGRVFSDMLAELDLYSLLQCRIISRGRYGRTREITLDLPAELIDKIHSTVLANFHLT